MLRDAGFPQFPRYEQAVNPEDAADIATAPTLSQVVEASGHHLRALINAKRVWYAVGDKNVSEGKWRGCGCATLSRTLGGLGCPGVHRMPRPSEKAIALEMIALGLARLVRQATALELPLLPYLIDMALLEAERELAEVKPTQPGS